MLSWVHYYCLGKGATVKEYASNSTYRHEAAHILTSDNKVFGWDLGSCDGRECFTRRVGTGTVIVLRGPSPSESFNLDWCVAGRSS